MTESLDKHETNQTFYDRISEAYDLIADAGERKARLAGEAALAVAEGDSVLEIGFGTGNSLINFASQVGPSGSVHGIDISPGMKKVTEAKLDQAELKAPVHLAVGDARELPYEDGMFDAVFSSFTLELFPLEDIVAVLQQAKRVLKSSGRIGIVSMSVVQENDHPSLLEDAYVWMHRHFPHLVDCQPIDVPEHLGQAGLKIDSQEEIKIWTMPVAVVIASA